MGTGGQGVNFIALVLVVGGEVGDQFGQQGHRFIQYVLHIGAEGHAAFEHAIEQVFHRPGQFGQHQGTDHAAAAFERVKSPAHFALSSFVGAVGQVPVQHVEDFVGFFEEDFAQLIVDRFFIGRRRQQTAGAMQRRRIQARDRAGQGIELGLARRAVGRQCAIRRNQRLTPGLFGGQVTERGQALGGQFQHAFASGVRVLEHAFQVILKAADHVGEMRQLRLGRRRVVDHQLFVDVIGATPHQARCAWQWNHRQGAAHLAEQLRQGFQALAVPVGFNAVDHQLFGLAQALAGLADHQLMNLRQVGGGQAAFFAAFRFDGADHAGQRGLDIEQGAGDVHQYGVVGFAVTLHQAQHHGELVDDHLARLAEAQHRQGIGDLPQWRQQRIQVVGVLAVAAHEQVEALLDPHQFLTQCAKHRPHGIAIRSRQPRPFGIDHGTVGQGLIQAVAFLETLHARRRTSDLGHIKQQALEQFVGRRLVDTADALGQQALELLVAGLEQAAQRRAVGDHAGEHAFDQRRGDLPQRQQRRALAQRFEARKHPRHVFQVARAMVFAQQASQGLLEQFVPLVQLFVQFWHCALGQGFVGQRCNRQELWAEQTGFRQQAFAAGAAQVVEQRQHHQRQVAAGAVYAVQIQRQLAEGLLQQADAFIALADALGLQGQGQFFDFFGEQRRTVELDHLQRAMHLVDGGQALGDGVAVVGFDKRIQRRTGLFQGFGNVALDPFKGHVVVPINHNCSA